MSTLTLEQCAAGNRTQRERAAFVKRVVWAHSRESGQELCAQLLEDPPDCVKGMETHDLLEAIPFVGPEWADAMQTACGLFEAVRVGELDAERRAALVALLRFRSPFTRRAA